MLATVVYVKTTFVETIMLTLVQFCEMAAVSPPFTCIDSGIREFKYAFLSKR